MRLQQKSLSRICLTDLLRRRRTNLEDFLNEVGIVTYDLLVSRCASMGVNPPSEEDFLKARGNHATHEISSPTEGIVVLNPPPAAEIVTDIESDPSAEENYSESTDSLLENIESPKKRRQKKSAS